MNWLVTADLHLDDKPQHSYRWGLFDWLKKQQRNAVARCGVMILGDLTDEKDRHSASLVNRMVDGLLKLDGPVLILKGNHDYIDKKTPFFGFLGRLSDEAQEYGTISYVSEPDMWGGMACIPHQNTQAEFDAACKKIASYGHTPDMILLHGLFEGAIGDTGARLTGLRPSLIEKFNAPLVLAGDVHRPQQVGPVTYVGAPYRVRFGDDYTPRVVLVRDNDVLANLAFPCPRKHSLVLSLNSSLTDLDLKRGDQVKITLNLPREEAVNWLKHRQRVLDEGKELGLEVFGISLNLPKAKTITSPHIGAQQTPLEIFEGFCEVEELPEQIKQAGKELLRGQIHPDGQKSGRKV